MTKKTLSAVIVKTLSATALCTQLMPYAWADVSLSVEGLEGPLQSNVDTYLSAIKPEDYSTSLRFQSRLEKAISTALKALGYYHPEIRFVVAEDKQQLTVTVTPGTPTLIRLSDIVLSGEAKEDPDFITQVEKSGLQQGDVLNHGHYQALKSGIRNLSLAKGYFDGRFTQSQLGVAPELNQAFIRLHYNGGNRYHFGATTIEGSQIDEVRVRSLIPYKEGDHYLASDVGLLHQNLSNTEWFSSVSVEPGLNHPDEGNSLPMKVVLVPQARNKLETGIGYSTDVGVRGTLKWQKPWLNRYGHSFDSSLSVSAPEQLATFGYQIPLEDVLNEYYRIELGLKNRDDNDTQSFESNLKLERHWQLESGWHRTASVRYLNENFEQGEQEDQVEMVLPGIAYSRTRISARSGTLPMAGDKLSVSMEIADELVVSPTRLLRLQGRTAWIRSIGENHRGLVRLDASADVVEQIEDIPPSLRFFAGGDNSLRGYEYQSVAPVDQNNDLIGAKYMTTSTLEYQYRLTGNWWLATFVDAGDAWSKDAPDWKTGTGVGVRWVSPVGPIRLDSAWGLDKEPEDRFRIHFTLGPEL